MDSFDGPIKAKTGRYLGNAILTEAMERDGRLSFKSYDRFFPNQDFILAGGLGNLVALPLQGKTRKNGNSVFVNDDFVPFADQWSYLQGMKKMSAAEVEKLVSRYDKDPLGELSKSSESAPWERPSTSANDESRFPKVNHDYTFFRHLYPDLRTICQSCESSQTPGCFQES